MRTASWVLLAIVAALLVVASVSSAWITYYGPEQSFLAGKRVPELGLAKDVEIAVRAQRGTAAAFGAAFAALLLFVVLGPYRRGEIWCWWAILVSLLVLNAITALRIPALGNPLGVGASATLLGISFVALLLDVRRLRQR